MRRKVSKIGSSTLMVSLPSKWCKANQVRQGDEMELEVTDTAITILPKEKQLALKSTAINVSGLSPSMVKRILAVYHKVGHDEVEVRFENAEQFHLVRERIKDMLIGYEIIEQSKNKCLIKYISGEGKTECGPVLRRLFLVVLSFADESYKAIAEQRTSDIEELFSLEDTINRLTNLLERTVHKEIRKDSKAIFQYLIIWSMEKIGNEYRDICATFINKNKQGKINKAILDIYTSTNALLRSYYQCYYHFSLPQFHDLEKEHTAIVEKLQSVSATTKEEIALVIHLGRIVGRIQGLFGSTLGLFIE